MIHREWLHPSRPARVWAGSESVLCGYRQKYTSREHGLMRVPDL
ncbi:hypothetical protein PM8797T_21203 [Gimesia maris DSM 8797]|nr:hypothetical protein PM8797T_21203 [Gimesia maris DSM 8797]